MHMGAGVYVRVDPLLDVDRNILDSLPRGRPDVLMSPGPRHGLYTSGLDHAQYETWCGLQRIRRCAIALENRRIPLDTAVKNLHGRAV
jgi:hypothetical protein